MQPREVITRRNLPHWFVPGAMHFITYRLDGTIPRHVLMHLRENRLRQLQGRPAPGVSVGQHRERVHKQFFADYDRYLDQTCQIDWLARPPVAALIRANLYHHAGSKYHLLAYCVMSNHVHILLQPIVAVSAASEPLADTVATVSVPTSGSLVAETAATVSVPTSGSLVAETAATVSVPTSGSLVPETAATVSVPTSGSLVPETAATDPDERADASSPLAKIMHSLKSYTAHEANKILRRTGQFWLHESYDHWVRDEDELERIVDYIATNPVKAGLVQQPHQWYFCSAHDRFLQDGSQEGWLLL